MYYVENETEEKVDLKIVRAILKKIVSYYGEKRDFSVTFVTDDEIQELNREYREIDAPTDILTFRLDDAPSFPISFDEEDMDFLNNEEMGDIFISLDTMRRNAEEFGVGEEEELSRLLLHGILHLRGLDHKTNDFEKEEMLKEQEEVLTKLSLKS
ncbi:MAG: rRNA maturation RNase YbeY [Spirochaetales bacterium]|nr:rRNA maturation RNase YbeY [Spirochaetales bacterium]